jgi:hypothetical protein
MHWLSFEASTLVNALVICSIFFAIHSSVRTRRILENGRPNLGLAMVLVGLATISLHYLASVVVLHFLPHFMPISDTWVLSRSLRFYGSWVIIGSGLLCLACGLHLVFRDMRTLALRLNQAGEKVEL